MDIIEPIAAMHGMTDAARISETLKSDNFVEILKCLQELCGVVAAKVPSPTTADRIVSRSSAAKQLEEALSSLTVAGGGSSVVPPPHQMSQLQVVPQPRLLDVSPRPATPTTPNAPQPLAVPTQPQPLAVSPQPQMGQLAIAQPASPAVSPVAATSPSVEVSNFKDVLGSIAGVAYHTHHYYAAPPAPAAAPQAVAVPERPPPAAAALPIPVVAPPVNAAQQAIPVVVEPPIIGNAVQGQAAQPHDALPAGVQLPPMPISIVHESFFNVSILLKTF